MAQAGMRSDGSAMAANVDREICAYPGKKARSKVWEHSGFYRKNVGSPIRENLEMVKAVCRLCKKENAYKGKPQRPLLTSTCFGVCGAENSLT